MSKKESCSKSQARKPDYKAGRKKLRSRTQSSNLQQPPAELLTQKPHESDGGRESILTSCIKCIGKNWFKLIAVVALLVSIGALISGNIHYAQLTKPHTELEDATTKLGLLEKQMDILGTYVHSQDVSQRAADGEDVISQAERLRNEAFHILAHCGTIPVFRKRGSILGSFNELLADEFAGCILMPREWVVEKWAKVKDLDRMAEIFAVPKSAICIRLRQLGLI